MAKVSQLSDSDRRQTRPGNANTHPGKVAMEALAVRRKPEVIEAEKKDRQERRQTQEKKKVNKKVAVLEIADFENQMDLDVILEETQFPRRQTKCTCPRNFLQCNTVMTPRFV